MSWSLRYGRGIVGLCERLFDMLTVSAACMRVCESFSRSLHPCQSERGMVNVSCGRVNETESVSAFEIFTLFLPVPCHISTSLRCVYPVFSTAPPARPAISARAMPSRPRRPATLRAASARPALRVPLALVRLLPVRSARIRRRPASPRSPAAFRVPAADFAMRPVCRRSPRCPIVLPATFAPMALPTRRSSVPPALRARRRARRPWLAVRAATNLKRASRRA